MSIIQLIYVYFQCILIKMQEGDVKAVYIVEPISRNHKNHTNHSASLLSALRCPAARSLFSYNFRNTIILRQFYELLTASVVQGALNAMLHTILGRGASFEIQRSVLHILVRSSSNRSDT